MITFCTAEMNLRNKNQLQRHTERVNLGRHDSPCGQFSYVDEVKDTLIRLKEDGEVLMELSPVFQPPVWLGEG